MTNPAEELPVYLPGAVVLPSELVLSLRQDRLVVFAGAGVSIDGPSGLPNFKDLTQSVCAMATAPFDPDEPYENQLGDLSDAAFPVHNAVRGIIDRSGSAPNDWHRAIAGLFPSPDQARIVTTNYDLHLESALTTDDVWSAPALPLGDSFGGVVHLHGAVNGPDAGLVVTDGDFGRAYLTQGWARRFLLSLFQKYDVLFVGYSHDDVVMQYLARGLPPESERKRYALVEPGSGISKWLRYRITAIEWEEDPSDRYGPGVKALKEWGRQANLTELHHRQHIEHLIAGGPALDPIDDSYLSRALEEPARVSVFTRFASGEEWLRWISDKATFKILFSSDAVLTEAQGELAKWFARTYVMKDEGNPLNLLAEQGGRLSSGLWRAIAYSLWRPGPSVAGVRQPWVAVLCQQDRGEDPTVLNYLLNECQLPDDRSSLLLLLQRLFEPNLRIRPGITFPGYPPSVSFHIDVAAEEHWVERAIARIITPQIGAVADGVYLQTTSMLARYFHLHQAFGQVYNGHDPISRMRPAIEPHAQNRYGGDALMAVDLAREAAIEQASTRGVEVVAGELLAMRVPILTRLATWLVAAR
ncbi:MAG: SIR2 family protein [Dehalococcoidia bacterium]